MDTHTCEFHWWLFKEVLVEDKWWSVWKDQGLEDYGWKWIGKQVKTLGTNNGLEFCTILFRSFCKTEGIMWHHIVWNTPQQKSDIIDEQNTNVSCNMHAFISWFIKATMGRSTEHYFLFGEYIFINYRLLQSYGLVNPYNKLVSLFMLMLMMVN